MKRGSGILLHITSLPGRFGIGTFGESAYQFVDFLTKSGQKYWQILPLGPTGFGDSPYQSFSSHAINPHLIDFDMLAEDGLLEKTEYEGRDFGQSAEVIDYTALFSAKFPLLERAFERAKDMLADQVAEFTLRHAAWLEDYALFMALKGRFGQAEWLMWDEDIKRREPEALMRHREQLGAEVDLWKFIQFIAYRQWQKLKSFANASGIAVIGDIPIYAAYDSADTWVNAASGIFKFDEMLRPVAFAGCPPDYFAPDGQHWGNPVYDWPQNKETGYAWWIQRLRTSFVLYDIVRIDHFRGLESYWEIPAEANTAAHGRWEQGPGMDLIRAVKDELGDVSVLAEDLGLLTPGVLALKAESGYPGMKVLHFAFDGYSGNLYLPHNYERNCVVYTGTHDNDTTAGWLGGASEFEKEQAAAYFNLTEDEGYNWGLIRGAFASVADVAVIPMQDILGLGSWARMNKPATIGGTNWKWSMQADAVTEELSEKLRILTHRYMR